MEAISAFDQGIQPEVATSEAGPALTPESAQNSSVKPPMTFQERIAIERQHNDREPTLP
jgi:hypothetical protein